MFERRVKMFLVVLVLFTGVLLVRAAQVQLLDHGYWASRAVALMSAEELIETARGRLLDRMGRELARDDACIDACVDYRAIVSPPDKDWVTGMARERLRRGPAAVDYAQGTRARRTELLATEVGRVRDDIERMWDTLAVIGGQSSREMDELRESIVRKVEMRRKYLWYARYQEALEQHESRDPAPWYQRWLVDDSQNVPELDQFLIHVAEEKLAHVILPAVKNDVNNYLGKNGERFPGLVLQPSVHRYYPYGDVAAHVIGRLSRVTPEDLAGNAAGMDPLRQYWRNDLIGRTGLEAVYEPLLRGVRGKTQRYTGPDSPMTSRTDPIPGTDVRTTIDIELQRQVQDLFTHVPLDHVDPADPGNDWHEELRMPGAAVVIDVRSGELLALVSYPSYGLNDFDEKYASLSRDDINRPLMNRATQFALEPGSAAKPVVGIGAITQGVFPADGTVECTGYLVIDGHKYSFGRCWTMSMFGIGHHEVPQTAPHRNGFLNFTEALERSCNVFFETLADKLGIEGLNYWFDKFGLGRPTGVEIPEYAGSIPGKLPIPAIQRRAAAWFSGIGQDRVLATPIQMANVAATIARNGIWVRPHLVPAGVALPRPENAGPDRVDLRLSPVALAAARQGMINAVNGRAGTGTTPRRTDMTVAGKTGTAQAASLKIPVRDAAGDKVTNAVEVPKVDENGQTVMVKKLLVEYKTLELGTHARPNPEAEWYRGSGEKQDKRAHAWYIGFAPAENPQIAFAVMVEYGGSGGVSAGYVVKGMLDACVQHGYLQKQ